MANANWSNPQLTSTYTNFVSEVKNRDEDLALQFDGTTSTNIPTNTIRWDSSAGRWKKWNGTSWAELTSTYALTGLSTTGAASIGTTLGVTGAITGSSTVTGTALIPSGSSVPVNGIYLPSANSVAIATNSSQRLAIDSSGNITIPGTLAVTGAITGSSTITSAAGSATAAGIQVGTGTTYKPGIYSPGTDQLALATGGSGRLFVDSSGRVGVGVTSPSSILDINGDLQQRNGAGVTIGKVENASGWYSVTGDSVNVNGTQISDTRIVRFLTASTERLRITSAGLVGIGTSSASKKVDIASSYRLQIDTENALCGPAIVMGGDNGSSQSGAQIVAGYESGWGLSFRLSSNSQAGLASDPSLLTYATKMRLTSTGLGIGTTSPGYTLDLNGTCRITNGTNPYIALFNGSNTGYVQVASGNLDVIAPSSGNITFNAGGERARIDTSGRFLVGTSSARSNLFNTAYSALFQVESQTTANAQASLTSCTTGVNGANLVLGHQRSGSVGGNTAVANNDQLGIVSFQGADGTNMVPSASIESWVDGTVATGAMPGRLVFSTTASGSASPTERFRIASDGSFSSVIPGGSTLYPRFGCRAWVNFNGTTASPSTIRGSGNVSSVTKNGTGDYTVNFSTAMVDANYCVQYTGAQIPQIDGQTRLATSSVRVFSLSRNDSYTLFDNDSNHVAIFR